MAETKIILACDESGAKGYADKDESFPGEVGVFAGILMPEDLKDEKMPLFQAVVDKYAGTEGKLHIADLEPAVKEALRKDVYDAISSSGLTCFWYALHVAGFHKSYLGNKALVAQARAAWRSPVKMGSPRDNPESLHTALFTGLYSRMIAFCEERGWHDLTAEIWLDNVDSPLVKNFESAAEELLDLTPTVHRATGFNTETRQVERGEIVTKVSLPAELEIETAVRNLQLRTVDDSNGLVLAADVLANSLAHLFHNRAGSEQYRPLNARDSVTGHPLFKQLDAFKDWGVGDFVGDGQYRHPKAP